MQDEVLAKVIPQIKSKFKMTMGDGWKLPEPKSEEVIRIILEHTYPELATGGRTVDQLSRAEYIDAISKFLVIVPKSVIRQYRSEPTIIRAQTDNPNYQALFAAPNVARAAFYGYESPFGVDYNGQVFQQEDEDLGMNDEMLRNPPELLNIYLELFQNRIAATDYGKPVQLDIVPVWNSNDESIERAQQDNAIKALLNRTDAPPMRSLLAVNQIESVMLFQIGLNKFSMRKLADKDKVKFSHPEVYPPTNAQGKTETAHGRYALYYDMEGTPILIAPYALNYMSWLASATRYVTDGQKIAVFGSELNLVRVNSGLLTDPIERVLIDLGDRRPEKADLMELSRIRFLLKEGAQGISARHLEPWFKKALEIAKNSGRNVVTPLTVDMAFKELIDNLDSFKPDKNEIRAQWLNIRQRVKLEILLPKMDQEVQSIVSGDMNKAERLYDEIEQEFIALAGDPKATMVTPEDSGEHIVINFPRLEEVRGIYRQKFNQDFQPNFLLRQIPGTRKGGSPYRDPQLMESVRLFLAHHNAMTATNIAALDQLYKGGGEKDPLIQQRNAELQPMLASFGYDAASFQEAVTLVNQMQKARIMVQEAKNQAPQ